MRQLSITLQQLALFVEVAETRSFTRAAERTAYGQPAVSKQIAALEATVGFPLFRQRGNQTVITAEAIELLRPAHQCLAAAERFEDSADKLRTTTAGDLLIGATPTLNAYLLPSIIEEFHRQYPDVRLVVRSGTSEQIQRDVHNSEVDCGLVIGPIRDQRDTNRRVIMVDDFVAIVSPTHAWGERTSVKTSDFEGVDLVVRERGSAARAAVDDAFRRAGVSVRIVLETNDTAVIKRAVGGGMGAAIISRIAAAPEVESGSLCAVELDWAELKTEFSLIWKKSRSESRALSGFLVTASGRPQAASRSPETTTLMSA